MKALDVDGAWLFTPQIHGDRRGSFLEWFREAEFREDVGHRMDLAQANCSVSGRGVVRGIHFSDVPPSQAKYVTCASGAIMDVVVDLRVGSPGFGRWQAVRLADGKRHPLDPAIGIAWPSDIDPVLSDKDAAAPTLAEAQAAGLLPDYAECQAYQAK